MFEHFVQEKKDDESSMSHVDVIAWRIEQLLNRFVSRFKVAEHQQDLQSSILFFGAYDYWQCHFYSEDDCQWFCQEWVKRILAHEPCVLKARAFIDKSQLTGKMNLTMHIWLQVRSAGKNIELELTSIVNPVSQTVKVL